jgi:acyl-lipid omega-6 desaturase (Delta-12 desaturase)
VYPTLFANLFETHIEPKIFRRSPVFGPGLFSKEPHLNPISNSPAIPDKTVWNALVAKYQSTNTWQSTWQVVNSFIPFGLIWYLMYLSLAYSYWLTLALALPAAGFLVRIFIIQHDCGHGSFFKSRKASDFLGSICGLLTLTPYHYWRKCHAIHHASAGSLAERGIGDIYTMTVKEYLQQSRWERLKYRIYRHPFIMFVLAPSFLFFVLYRIPLAAPKSWKRERVSVHGTNLALALVVIGLSSLIGFKSFLLIQLPIAILAATMGTWLFFVQHQFEDTYYASGDNWDYTLAALQGSSYYQLPKVLQWFTGNIGFHHIHHLSPRIPNYRLQKCHEENPMFQQVVVLTVWTSLQSILLSLWDEDQNKLVSFRHLKSIPQPEG